MGTAEREEYADVVIVGTGVAGLYSALNLPRDKRIIMITKSDVESSDSFLAQGGICVLRNEADYDSYFEDTMRAGHYENRKESVDIMIRSSQAVIGDLIGYGVEFQRAAEQPAEGNPAADDVHPDAAAGHPAGQQVHEVVVQCVDLLAQVDLL